MAPIHIARKWRKLALEEQRIAEILEAEQLARDCETDPTFRHEMQLEGQRQLEQQRDAAFENMQYQFLLRSRSFADHKQYWAWYKQAKLELQQLRETERLEREHAAQETDIFPLVRDNPLSPQSRKAYESRLQPYPPDRTAEILPIITPEAFRLQHPLPQPRPWFGFNAEKKVETKTVESPGKRFSAREMPRFRCDPEHYTWISKGLRSNFLSNITKYNDRRRKEGLCFWAQGSGLIRSKEMVPSHIRRDEMMTVPKLHGLYSLTCQVCLPRPRTF